MPEYSFNEFKRCCIENQFAVKILKQPEDDAKFFGLKTKGEIKNFIGNDGLEDLNFINTKEWENNPDKSFTILVDAYEFKSRYKLGYIAFMYNKKTGFWIVKSFHPSINNSFVMELALRRAGIIGEA
jgi:hypothetical protein